MLRNLKLCFGMCFVTVAILVAESAYAGGSSCVQEGDKSIPEISIVSAVYGKGRGSIRCTNEVAKIVLDTVEITEISAAGLGLKSPPAKAQDFLKIWYRLDGQVVRRADGKEALLFLKAGSKSNIRASILSHARRLAGENFEKLRKVENPESANSKTEKAMESNSAPDSSSSAGLWEKTDESNAAVESTAIARPEFANKPKNFEKSLSTVQGLMIQETGAGQQFGEETGEETGTGPVYCFRPAASEYESMVLPSGSIPRVVSTRVPP